MEKKTHIAVVFGSFDLLHKGHRYFLQQSRKHGERLIAVLARDEEITHLKQRKPAWDFATRQAALLESGLADEVWPSDTEHGSFTVLGPLLGEQSLSIVLGEDQKALKNSLQEFLKSQEHKVNIFCVRARHRKVLSSTRLHQIRSLGAYAILFSAMLFWGYSWVLGKLMVISGLPAPLATTLRMGLLALFFLLWNLLHCSQKVKKEYKKNPKAPSQMQGLFATTLQQAFYLDKKNFLLLVYSGIFLTVYNLCFFYGLQTVFISQGGVLTSVLVPVFSTLFYHLGQRIGLSGKQILGLLIGLLGGFILMGGLSYMQTFLHSSIQWQSSFFIGTGLSWSILTLLSGKIQKHYSLQQYSFYIYFFAAILSSWGWFWYRPGLIEWRPLLALIFLGNIIGTSLYFQSLRLLKPSHVANCLFLNPISILLMSWIFLSEPWTMQLSIGGILAILAILLLNGRHHYKPK